jgi:HKD family nuclease
MKLISTNAELRSNLLRLTKEYPSIAFAVAWASARTEIFVDLSANRDRIRKAVIGTHFYQTHPDVLEAFVGSSNVRFILQPRGVFHPKIYIFWDVQRWEVLMGSANLTAGALNTNSEAMALISDADQGDSCLKEEVMSLIERYWDEARTISNADTISYRALWSKQQPALRRLSGQYGKSTTNKAPADSAVMSMTWPNFFSAVQKDAHHGFEKRCDLLRIVRAAFEKIGQFQLMELGLRKTIAGLPNDFDKRWGWFGSMQGAGYYHQAVNDNNSHISKALDEIPLNGPVAREHYEAYRAEFVSAFPNGRHGIGIASRLLALKRPDYFVCFDSKNKKPLCEDFEIKQSDMNYERYWEEIILRIIDSAWWNEPCPRDALARTVWDGRAAMLDAIFYRP